MDEDLWKEHMDRHDYTAAREYLTLIWANKKIVNDVVVAFASKDAEAEFKAKDILRAARVPILPEDNPNVAKHLKHWDDGQKRSPILLARDGKDSLVHIADGYHRTCAAYWLGENTVVRCRIV